MVLKDCLKIIKQEARRIKKKIIGDETGKRDFDFQSHLSASSPIIFLSLRFYNLFSV